MVTVENVLQVTSDEERRIKANYKKSEEELAEDVEILRDWLKKQPHLPHDEEEHRLKMLLIINKFDLEKAKKKLDMYYSIKHLVPEFYDFRHPLHPVMSLQMDNIIMTPLPKLTPECHRVYLLCFKDDDAEKFVMNVFIKLIFISLDLRMTCDSVLGDRYIIDFKLAKLGHIVQFTPSVVIKSYTILEKVYSDQIKGVHFINLPPGAGVVVTLIKAVLSKKLGNRVKVHKNYKSLQKVIPKEILPAEYGGTTGTVAEISGNWREYVESKNDWIKQLCDKKSDESKRVGEPPNSNMFGMCNSFKKLTLD